MWEKVIYKTIIYLKTFTINNNKIIMMYIQVFFIN